MSRALPPVGWQRIVEQDPHTTTVCERERAARGGATKFRENIEHVRKVNRTTKKRDTIERWLFTASLCLCLTSEPKKDAKIDCRKMSVIEI